MLFPEKLFSPPEGYFELRVSRFLNIRDISQYLNHVLIESLLIEGSVTLKEILMQFFQERQ